MLPFSRRRKVFIAAFQLLAVSILSQRVHGFSPASQVPSSLDPVGVSKFGRQNFDPLYATNLKTKTKIRNELTQSPLNDTSVLDTLIVENSNPELVFLEDEETLATQEKMKNAMLFLCFGVALLSALDRVAMSVAMVPMSAEFGYTETMKGSVSSLFSVGYGLGIVPAGIVVATASPRIVMACGIAVWSVATIATPYAAAFPATMVPLLLARASVGAAESVVLPTLQTLLSSWTTTEEKSRSLATVFTGFHVGTVSAYLLSPLLMDYFGGWESLFLIYGGVGLFWLIPWLLFSKDQPESQYDNGLVVDVTNMKADAATVDANTDLMGEISKSVETLKAAPWKGFATSKGAWAMLLAHAANNWGLYNCLAWSPTFYSEQYGLSVRDSALYSVLPSIAGALGGLVAGTLSDALLQNLNEEEDDEKRIQKTTNLRKAFQGAALGIPAIALFTLSSHIPDQPWVAQSLLMATTGLQAFNAAGYLSANQEKAGERWAGLLYSITSLPAVMVGTTGVYLTGQILDYTNQDWSVVFALNAAIFVLGAASFVALYDSKREFD